MAWFHSVMKMASCVNHQPILCHNIFAQIYASFLLVLNWRLSLVDSPTITTKTKLCRCCSIQLAIFFNSCTDNLFAAIDLPQELRLGSSSLFVEYFRNQLILSLNLIMQICSERHVQKERWNRDEVWIG
ncbi:hypothetical protein OUZ56_024106 [Daphnia magna]|uniref:Uncharacterized protein n=1 Tax=Daphnia magna TaxID=35525 RepID=A0ABR0B0U5_9CRUS|nr:hypothetical protein OUZ56_024106 [Daphnia magna]